MTNEEIMKTATECNEWFNNLDDVIRIFEKCKNENKNVYVKFSGQKLYSLIDNRDSCYKKVTGKTYEEFQES